MDEELDALNFLAQILEEADAKLREVEAYSTHCTEHLNWHRLSGEKRAFIAATRAGAQHALQSLRNSNAYV